MAINKVVYGDRVLIDLTQDTVAPDTLLQGVTAHDKSGAIIFGEARSYEEGYSSGASSRDTEITELQEQVRLMQDEIDRLNSENSQMSQDMMALTAERDMAYSDGYANGASSRDAEIEDLQNQMSELYNDGYNAGYNAGLAEGSFGLPTISGLRLITPTVRPEQENLIIFRDGNRQIDYGDSDGMLSLPCLAVTPSLCPNFAAHYDGYDIIMYVYEPTSDNMGMGLTVPAGWYAVNTSTFAFTQFDLENNPIEILVADLLGSPEINSYLWHICLLVPKTE